MKSTIIFYKEWLPLIQSLPTSVQLEFWTLWSNYTDKTYSPVIKDAHLKGVFDFIISQVKKADEKYNDILQKRSKAGIASGSSRTNKRGQMRTHVKSDEQKETKLTQAEDKENVKDKDKENVNENVFEKFRVKFPGVKKGLETEFKNFTTKHKDWKEILPTLETKLDGQIAWRKKAPGFVPEWKHLQTWINQRDWEAEVTLETNGVHPDSAYSDPLYKKWDGVHK